MMLEGMAKQGAARANEVLNRAPEEIERYLANKNQEFSTEQECLRELHLIANLGAIASNIMPFSSSWAFEDQNGGFHTRLRLLADGEKLHVNFTCSGSTLSGEILSWSADTPDSEPQSGDTLNAALGALFLLNQRGAFSESNDQLTGDILESKSATPPLTAGTLIGFRQEVGSCWVVSPDIKASVTVGFELDREGRVMASTLRLLSSSSEDPVETEAAFVAARRAVLRCQGDGYVLPPDKYEEWRDMELLFDIETAGIR